MVLWPILTMKMIRLNWPVFHIPLFRWLALFLSWRLLHWHLKRDIQLILVTAERFRPDSTARSALSAARDGMKVSGPVCGTHSMNLTCIHRNGMRKPMWKSAVLSGQHSALSSMPWPVPIWMWNPMPDLMLELKPIRPPGNGVCTAAWNPR